MNGTQKKKNTLRAKTQKKKKTAMWGCLTFFWFNLFFYLKK